MNPVIILSVINEVCGSETSAPQNMGGKKQCIEGPVKTMILATESFAFASVAALKAVVNYDTGVTAKSLVPFPNVEGIELANTEANIKTGRYTDYTLKNGVAGVAYRFDLSICTYEALKSYINSVFTRVFEITEAEEVTCDVQSDGTVKGRKMTSFLVGQRNQATDADVPFANVNIKFDSDIYDIVRAEFAATKIEGIFDVTLKVQGVPSATTLVVEATDACTGENISSLLLDDWKFVQTSDTLEEAVTVSSYDAVTGFYTLTALAFEDGTIATDGVVEQNNIKYEAAPVAVNVV